MRFRSGDTLAGMASCTGKPNAAPSMAKRNAGVAAGGVEQRLARDEQAARSARPAPSRRRPGP